MKQDPRNLTKYLPADTAAAGYFVTGNLKTGHCVEIAWANFKLENSEEIVGVKISEPKPNGKRIKRYRIMVNFSTITVAQAAKLMDQKCPFIGFKAKKQKVEPVSNLKDQEPETPKTPDQV